VSDWQVLSFIKWACVLIIVINMACAYWLLVEFSKTNDYSPLVVAMFDVLIIIPIYFNLVSRINKELK